MAHRKRRRPRRGRRGRRSRRQARSTHQWPQIDALQPTVAVAGDSLADRGRFASREPDAPFVPNTSWFDRRDIDVVDERDGLRMHFAGWVHPLPHHINALREAGLALVDLAEPRPDEPANPSLRGRWDRVPLFCWLTAGAQHP